MSHLSTSSTIPQTTSTPTLLTIPPELLLQILTHLRHSSSLHALSLTCHTINNLLHTHAPSICNSLIHAHRFSASRILLAQHTHSSSGFLVPTHPLVLTEERRIQRDKILASGCHCPPCRLMVHAGTSSTSDLSISDQEQERDSDGLMGTCLPSLSMTITTTRGNECKAKEALGKAIKLTSPGPQFLVFLERYGWEVEARWEVYVKHRQLRDDVIKEEDEDGGERVGDNVEEKRKVFEFMIGNYCVRRFLEDTEKELSSFATLTRPTSNSLAKVKITIKERLRGRLRKTFRLEKKEKKEKKLVEAAPTPTPTPRRMFGEIEKSPTTSAEKNSWAKGLLWYHGSKCLFDPVQLVDGDKNPDPVIGSNMATKKKLKRKMKVKVRDCVSVAQKGMNRVGESIGCLVRRLHCISGGEFEELEELDN